MEQRSQLIAQLNDAFRQTIGPGSQVYITEGIQALSPLEQFEVVNLVKTFNDFSEGNDPYGEHDFGSFDFKGNRAMWKIDYYDKELELGSEDPADPEKTTRVLTIMMGWEY
ncbi:MAG: DUF3768 domain-containing protein [Bacteroidota bacterium]